jgi:hypothetical protein
MLSLGDRCEAELRPLDIHVLRQCSNGKTFTSTDAVGRDMGMSDEIVRVCEQGPQRDQSESRPGSQGPGHHPDAAVKAYRQPMARELCAGRHPRVTAAAHTAHRAERIMVASGLLPEPGGQQAPCGALVSKVRRVAGDGGAVPHPHPHPWHLVFQAPATFPEYTPSAGQPSSFDASLDIAAQLPRRDGDR